MFLSRKNHLNCVSLCLELSSWSASPPKHKVQWVGDALEQVSNTCANVAGRYSLLHLLLGWGVSGWYRSLFHWFYSILGSSWILDQILDWTMLCIQDFEASNFLWSHGEIWLLDHLLSITTTKKKSECLVCQLGVNQWFSTFRATHMTLASF